MSRTKNASKNIFFNVIYQIVNILLNFILRQVFINTLGVEFLGINSLFTDVLGMLSVIDLGFNTAMVYSFYKPLADGDQRKISALVTFYRGVYRKIAICIAISGIALTPFIHLIVNTDNNIPFLHIYFLFSLVNVVVSYLFIYKTTILTADQKNYIVMKTNIYVTILKFILQIFLLLIFKNYILYLLVGIIANILSNFIASKKATQLYPYINNKENINNSTKKNILDNIKSVFIYKVSSIFLTATDNIIISFLVGTAAVGYYSNYLMINNKIVGIISLLFTSLTAGIGNLIVTEREEKRFKVFSIEQTVSFIICGVVIPCFYSLVEDLLKVWLGTEYALGSEMALVVSLNMYLACVLQPLWSYREATGLYSRTKWIMLIAAVLNIILSILFGKIWGTVGIVFASAISRVATYVWYEPKLLFKLYFKQSFFPYLKRVLFNFFIIIFLSICLKFVSSYFIVTNWLQLGFKASMYMCISVIFMVILYRKSDAIKWLVDRINKLWRKKF